MLLDCSEISFERIHSICKKSTPKQLTLYQIALKTAKIISEIADNCAFEHVTLLDQNICTLRVTTFEIFKSNRFKIGMNTTANKLFHVSLQPSGPWLEFCTFQKINKNSVSKIW